MKFEIQEPGIKYLNLQIIAFGSNFKWVIIKLMLLGRNTCVSCFSNIITRTCSIIMIHDHYHLLSHLLDSTYYFLFPLSLLSFNSDLRAVPRDQARTNGLLKGGLVVWSKFENSLFSHKRSIDFDMIWHLLLFLIPISLSKPRLVINLLLCCKLQVATRSRSRYLVPVSLLFCFGSELGIQFFLIF